MQKTCPRCGVTLSLDAESIQTPWIFARCFQCHQTNLIQYSSEIKKAPPAVAAKAVLPIHESPSVLISESLRAQIEKPIAAYQPKKRTLPQIRGRSAFGLLGITLIGVGGGILAASPQFKAHILEGRSLLHTRNPASLAEAFHLAPRPIAAQVALPVMAQAVESPIQAKAAPEPLKIEVIADQALFRSGPGTKFRKLGLAAAHLELIVRSQENEWIQVELPSKLGTGWIRQDLTRRTQDSVAVKVGG